MTVSSFKIYALSNVCDANLSSLVGYVTDRIKYRLCVYSQSPKHTDWMTDRKNF